MRPRPHLQLPRRQLDPRFRAAVRDAMVDGRSPGWLLAALGGFPQQAVLSSVLHASAVKASSQTIARLRRVAQAIGYPADDIFVREPVEPAVAS